jgi:hypothetical protein
MTQKLEELLNLPEYKETVKDLEKEIKSQAKEIAKQEEIEHEKMMISKAEEIKKRKSSKKNINKRIMVESQ